MQRGRVCGRVIPLGYMAGLFLGAIRRGVDLGKVLWET